MPRESHAYLCEVDRPETVTAISHALTSAGIPYQTSLVAAEAARVVLFVPWQRLGDARRVVDPYLAHVDPVDTLVDDDEDLEALGRPRLPAPAFPWGPVQAVASMVLMHLGLVFWAGSTLAFGPDLVELGGIRDLTGQQPWRLFTAMFVHVDPAHVVWNGVSMLVFAVPLVGWFGYRETTLIYVAAGLGGGITAWLFLAPDSIVVGSSGAVAGLFGAWVVQAWQRAERAELSWRGKMRSLGIAALVLPSLISPVNSAGHPVSVASHLGGLATGIVVGALISRRLARGSGLRDRRPDPADPRSPW